MKHISNRRAELAALEDIKRELVASDSNLDSIRWIKYSPEFFKNKVLPPDPVRLLGKT